MNLSAFFRSTRFRVLLCVLALLTGVMLYSLKSGAHTDYATRFLQSVTAPARRASAAISNDARRKLDTYYESNAYREENARLRAEIAELNQQLIGYDDAVQELEALRDQLEIKKKNNGFVLSEPCRVLMPNTNDMTRSFLIDMGEEDGITLNAPVICADGLIGIISEVSAHFSPVTTILSPELSVGALILQTGDGGIVEGNLRDAAENRTKMMYLDQKSAAEAGNLVITAGTSGLFPYGLAVGTVTETGLEDTGLTRYAMLAPSVDFTALESVTVLLDFEGKGESFDEN